MKGLKGLDNCKELRSLFLQTLSGNLKNPVCDENQNYRANIFSLIPSLRRLDGITKEINFTNGEELKKQKEVKINFNLNETGVWYTKSFPKVETA